jgi:hypothetical protein
MSVSGKSIAIAVFLGLLVFAGLAWHRSSSQAIAYKKLQGLEAQMLFDIELGDIQSSEDYPWWWNYEFLRHLFSDIGEVDLMSSRIDDETIVVLNELRGLRRLHFAFCKIDESCLSQYSPPNSIKYINFRCSNISDNSIVDLRNVCVEHLDLAGTRITEQGFRYALDLRGLKSLNVSLSDSLSQDEIDILISEHPLHEITVVDVPIQFKLK